MLKKAIQEGSDDDAGTAVKTPKLQRVTNPASKNPTSDPVEEPERCDLM